MLIEKLEQGENFAKHESDVARYILEHAGKVPGMSSAQLARNSLTSKATVVRLCQKLGLTGYQELRLKLVEEINQKNRLSRMLEGEPIHSRSTYTDIINTLPVLYDKAVTNTRLSLDKNVMNRLNQGLQRAECIDIYGAGISYMLAQAAAFKFATLGMESSAYESINGHYLAARRAKRTLAFLVSFTGANRTMIRAAKFSLSMRRGMHCLHFCRCFSDIPLQKNSSRSRCSDSPSERRCVTRVYNRRRWRQMRTAWS